MVRYHTVSVKELEIHGGRTYPSARPNFRPAAYVVLTRKNGVKSEKPRG
jgi:hypothetical protein